MKRSISPSFFNAHLPLSACMLIGIGMAATQASAQFARPALPDDATALRFAIVPDTQGEAADNANNNGVPTAEVQAVTAELLAQSPAPAFAIHVGDVTEGNKSGADKLSEFEDFNALMTTPLLNAGIDFYPVRGNHDKLSHILVSGGPSDGLSAWEAAFPLLFPGATPTIDPTNVPNGSIGSPNANNYSFVLDAGNDTFLIALDMWEGGVEVNYSDWIEAQFVAIRATHPDAHIFVYAHSNLQSVSWHPATVEHIGEPQDLIDSSIQHNIDGWFGGHNHIYDRSMITDPNNSDRPALFNITAGSASFKFYPISRSPTAQQRVNRVIDSANTPDKPIAYQIVTVNGPFVNITNYMSPGIEVDSVLTFTNWSIQDEYSYSTNGQQFTLAPNQTYNSANIADTAPAEADYFGTSMQLLDATNLNTTNYSYDGGTVTFDQYRNITTGWWAESTWHTGDDHLLLISDILSIHGMTEQIAQHRTDPYTLLLSYDPAEFPPTQETALSIVAFLDPNTADALIGGWMQAVDATLGTPAPTPLLRAPLPSDALGTWGIDTANQQVWARLDYQGDFAVTTNVVDSDDDRLDDAWELTHLTNLDASALTHSDADTLNNLQEYFLGTSPTLADSDGDLFADDVELAHSMDPLTADTALSDSVLNTLRTDLNAQDTAGLYPVETLGGISYDQPLIEVDASNQVTISVQLWHSADFTDWFELGSPVQRSEPASAGKQFYKWTMTAQ